MLIKKVKIKSFTLVEVLVFIAIIMLFFVIASAVTVAILRDMKINEHKIVATRYAEEAMEWLKNEKESDWKLFTSNATCASNKCFYDLSWSGSCNVSCSKIDGRYSRTVDFQSISPTVTSVTIRVSWSETGNTYIVPIQSTFSFFD